MNKNQIKDTFYGKAKLIEGEKLELRIIKENWNNFNSAFWFIFLVHLGIKALVSNQEEFSLIMFSLQFFPMLAMAGVMGAFAYKFSKQKTSVLYGLLGFLWIVLVGIFIGYFAVRRLRNKAVEKLNLEVASS